jgi:hypothetical protein
MKSSQKTRKKPQKTLKKSLKPLPEYRKLPAGILPDSYRNFFAGLLSISMKFMEVDSVIFNAIT